MEKQESATSPLAQLSLLNDRDVPKELNASDWFAETENLGIDLNELENVSNNQPELKSQMNVNKDEDFACNATFQDATDTSVIATIENVLQILNETILLLQKTKETSKSTGV